MEVRKIFYGLRWKRYIEPAVSLGLTIELHFSQSYEESYKEQIFQFLPIMGTIEFIIEIWNVLKIVYFVMTIYLIENYGIILHHISTLLLIQMDGLLLQVFVLVSRLQEEQLFCNMGSIQKKLKMFQTLSTLDSSTICKLK